MILWRKIDDIVVHQLARQSILRRPGNIENFINYSGWISRTRNRRHRIHIEIISGEAGLEVSSDIETASRDIVRRIRRQRNGITKRA